MEKRKSYGSLKDISRRHARTLSMLRASAIDKEGEGEGEGGGGGKEGGEEGAGRKGSS